MIKTYLFLKVCLNMSRKQDKLQKAIETFDSSDKTVNDYLNLFFVVSRTLKSDNGIVWTEVRESINKALSNKPNVDNEEFS
jgi:hypothetical protein